MYLRDLLKFKQVVVQCHDNPDADAIASGWAVYLYFQQNNIPVRFIYGGKFPLQKSNLVLMKDTFNIPIEYETNLVESELLVTVDCQYGEGNVQRFHASNVAVIDHHRVTSFLPELSEVRSNMGSCSTIVWDMLAQEGIDVNDNTDLATALYYGLLTDTNGFAELSHPLDRDLRDFLKYRKSNISLFRNSNLSIEELKIAGQAMENCVFCAGLRYGFVESKPCDPNILGIISDAFLEVDGVDSCLVYSILKFGVKISVRSCVKETKANELAEYLAEGIGSGGGHLDKAGGFIDRKALEEIGVEYTTEGIRNLFSEKLETYFRDTEIIYAAKYEADTSKLKKYAKNRLHLGYVDAGLLAPAGTVTSIRTLEGDVDTVISDEVYIMIGIDGEIYPCKKETFLKSNEYSDEPYVFPGEYEPSVKDAKTGQSLSVVKYAKSCYSTARNEVLGMELDHRVKVFTSWDEEKYYLGKPGDFLVSKVEDPNDVYVVQRHIFFQTYSEV